MRISDLRECVILAQTHSFTRTAQILYTTQSAVSKHISIIERELGCQLFIRDKQGVELTRFGEEFIIHANRAVVEYNEAVAAVENMKRGVGASLSIGYLAGAVSQFLPPVIRMFQKKHPDIDIRCYALEIDEIIAKLDSGEIDIAILMDYVQLPKVYSLRPLYGDRLCLIVPKGHRFSGLSSVSVNDLQGERILTANPYFMVRESPLIQNLIASVRLNLSVSETANDVLSLFMLMETGNYITIFFDHIRNYADFANKFDFIALDEAPDGFDVVAAWRTSSETDAIRDFVAMLEGYIDSDRG